MRTMLVRWCVALLAGVVSCALAAAQERDEVHFQINQTTTFGQSVYVLGDLPELGGNDVRFALKLEPGAYPLWRAPVSLPVNCAYSFRFYLRNDAASQWGNAGNGTALGSLTNAMTSSVALSPAQKTIFVHSTVSTPTLWWRQGSGAYSAVSMHDVGPGRNAGERRWCARQFGDSRRETEFYFTNSVGGQRDPASGTYRSSIDRLLVQDGGVFAQVPAPAVSGPTKQYNAASPPGINSTNLGGEFRRYRVILPRGYAQHASKRYPVLYMHDGQNVFEVGPFGTWDADATGEYLMQQGRMREVILVGIDNTSNRFNNYVTPDDGGQAHAYVAFVRDELKPIIDATYRTLTGPDDTGAMGSSLGGVVSLYMGWDYAATFGRVGAMSGSWQLTGFPNRVKSQTRRTIRLYMDSGDAGSSNDGFWGTVGLRDNLISLARPGGSYVERGDFMHTYGPGQQHNEAAWAARLPGAFEFLFPASEEPNGLAGEPSARGGDVNDDDLIDIEDLYAWEQGLPGAESSLDVNRNGSLELGADRAELIVLLRGAESADVAGV